MPFVNFRTFFCFFSFDFRQNFDVRTFPRRLSEHTLNQNFFERYQKKIFLHLHFGPIIWVPKQFLKILIFFIGEICILIMDF